MRVCVLGHRGMLGHVLVRYFQEKGCSVNTVATRFSASTGRQFVAEILSGRPDWCVNAIATRRQDFLTERELFEINAHLPEACSQGLPEHVGFIHASTDAVFSAALPHRKPDEPPDATDAYGRSKIAAERAVAGPRRGVIRCSIIGPDQVRIRNLLSWLLDQQGAVKGYTNQTWNGITTLEWAKLCYGWFSSFPTGQRALLQPAAAVPINKCDLLERIAAEWQHKVAVVPALAEQPVFRTLVAAPACPRTEQMLADLREWYYSKWMESPAASANQ